MAIEHVLDIITAVESAANITAVINYSAVLATNEDVTTTNLALFESTGYSVIEGLRVYAQNTPDMSINVEGGIVYMPRGKRAVIAVIAALTILAADPSLARIDRVYTNSSGQVTYAQGTAAASPVAPELPSGSVKGYRVNVAAGVTSITNADFVDEHTIKAISQNINTVNVKDFGAKGDGTTDDTAAILAAIKYADINDNGIVIAPFAVYRINLLYLLNISDVIIDFCGSTLKGMTDIESRMLEIRNCSNLTIKNFILDGNNTFFRGLRLWDGNTNVTIESFTIKNISPKIQANPTNINSVALDVHTDNNNNISFRNFVIDTVKNNDNTIIGDSIGSSRGIVVQEVTSGTTHSSIKFDDFKIKNILSEDGDGIHVLSNVSNSTNFDVKFTNFEIDNCKRRHIKLQTARGCIFDTFKLKHTNRSFSMAASISELSLGNMFKNFTDDVKAVKGIEVTPVNNTDTYISTFRDFSLVLDNTATIDGSTVFGIDLLSVDHYTINNVEIENFNITTPNAGIIGRTFTRNIYIRNGQLFSYTGDKTGIDFTFNPAGYTASDGTSISHKFFNFDNITADGYPLYMGDNNTTVGNGTVGILISRSGLNQYSALDYKSTDIQIGRREYRGTTYPTAGN